MESEGVSDGVRWTREVFPFTGTFGPRWLDRPLTTFTCAPSPLSSIRAKKSVFFVTVKLSVRCKMQHFVKWWFFANGGTIVVVLCISPGLDGRSNLVSAVKSRLEAKRLC